MIVERLRLLGGSCCIAGMHSSFGASRRRCRWADRWLTIEQTPDCMHDCMHDYILLYPEHIRCRYKYEIRLQVPGRDDDGREPVQVLL
jgi:hypothetical protein